MLIRSFRIAILVASCFVLSSANANTPVEVLQVTPSGDGVPASEQILINFSQKIAPLGRMSRSSEEVPVNIKPALDCQWRWLTPSTLACQLDQNKSFKLATEYTIKINVGELNEEGASLTKAYQHSFRTTIAKVDYAHFDSQLEVGKPLTMLSFNQVVTKQSVAKTARFRYIEEGTLEIVDMKAIVLQHDSWKKGGPNKPLKQSQYWLVQPKKALPKNTAVELLILPGLSTQHGHLKSKKGQIVKQFHTFDDFKFIGVSCFDAKDEYREYSTLEFGEFACNPSRGVNINFSTPINRHELFGFLSLWRAGEKTDALKNAWKDTGNRGGIYSYHSKDKTYSVSLPSGFFPDSHFEIRKDSANTDSTQPTDLLGQSLLNEIRAEFKTLHYTPTFDVPYQDVVLEQQVASDVPIRITNIDSLDFSYSLADNIARKKHLDLNFPEDQKAVVSMGVRELLENKSGMLSGYFTSKSVAADKYRPRQKIVAQITPYQVHAKMGHFSSLVWVTDLATGELVENAKVEVLKSADPLASRDVAVLDHAVTNEYGVALLKGVNEVDPKNSLTRWCRDNKECPRMFIRVNKGEHSAILPVSYKYQVGIGAASNYEVYSRKKDKYGHIQAWGTTAQGIYRRGDTIQYKIYLRDQSNTGLVAAPKANYKLALEDGAGKVVHELTNIKLNEHGSMSGEIKLSESAVMGWHSFVVSSDFSEEYWYPLSVLVTDFTPSPFRLTQKLNGDIFTPEQSLVITTDASLHSGGAYTGAEAAIEALVKPLVYESEHTQAKGYKFSEYSDEGSKTLFEKTLPIGGNGQVEASTTLPALEGNFLTAEIFVRTGVQDDRGKSVISSSKARYFGVDRLVGLKSTQWVYDANKPAIVNYIVVDKTGTPVSGTVVDISITKRDTKLAKVKSAGSAYLADYQESWIETASCSGITNNDKLDCAFTPTSAGVYRYTASIKDTQNRQHEVSQDIWVIGEGYVNWHESNTDALKLVPEKSDYKVGETARYLVNNPYPGAQALITIERYGVIKSWQQTLHGSTPVVEFEITPEYMPGVYLSVLVTAPRAGHEVPALGQVDLAKPTYKIGYQQINVSDPYKSIVFDIETDADIYKPGDVVSLNIKPELLNVSDDQDMELVVSVLDEAVFDLVKGGSSYFDPYQGFNSLDGLDVSNYSLLPRLIGLQKFSKKGANPGGGGGQLDIRGDMKGVAFYADSIVLGSGDSELEEVTVTATQRSEADLVEQADITERVNLVDSADWRDKVTVNDDGTVSIKFKLPDNLTAWRVLVIATTPSDRMGLGQHSFKVNQPTEIRPVMPNQLLEGDQFNAGFSIHNRSEEARTLSVSIKASGDTENTNLFEKNISLEAHARETVLFPMSAGRLTRGAHQGAIQFLVQAQDSSDGDALKHHVPVNKNVNLTSAAVYGSTTGDAIEQSILVPKDIANDLGGISVRMSPSIISNVDGAFKYIQDYPYACWEQKLTKAVMASHYKSLAPYLSEELKWQSSSELPQATLDNAISYQADNGGMAYFIASDQYVSPYLSAYTALAFTWLRDAGYTIPVAVKESLHQYLNTLLRKDSFPSYFTKGMRSTVRAVALAALAKSGGLSRADLMRYVPHRQQMSLFGKAQLLQALMQFDNTEKQQQRLIEELLASSNSSAGKIGFNDALDTDYSRIHSSQARTNCAILDSLSSSPKLLLDQTLPSKLAQTVVAYRKGNLHWENTQDNVFCLNALNRYASSYEAEQPRATVNVSLNEETVGQAVFGDYKDPSTIVKKLMQPALVGSSSKLSIEHDGQGRVYYQALLQYSENNEQADRENSGIDIRREQSVFRKGKWRLLNAGDVIHRGEVLRSDVFLSVPADRNFVAVRDPVAGGLEPVNKQLATSGTSLKTAGINKPGRGSHYYSRDNWQGLSSSPWGFYHQELGHDAVTFYSDYLPKGQYHLSYRLQAIATGEFLQQAVHAEEMYHPDVYGKGDASRLRIIE